MGLLDDTAVELGKKIKSGEVTVKEAVHRLSGSDRKSRKHHSCLCDY